MPYQLMDIPKFKGSTDERLNKANIWAAENCPGREFTLEEIANLMGVTRERVRQIEIEALQKLNVRLQSDSPFSEQHDKPKRRRRKKADADDSMADQAAA